MTNDNDRDDPLPFISLAAITANVTRFLTAPEKQRVNGDSEQPKNAEPEQRGKAQRDLVFAGKKR